MKNQHGRKIMPILAALLLAGVMAMPTSTLAAQAPVLLGTTESFAVLAGETITNTGPTTITGDVGLYPGTAITGSASITLDGTYHTTDPVAQIAKDDLVIAYNDAAGRLPVTRIATQLGGQVLTPGVYDSATGTFNLTGTLTLNAGGDPDGVFIFLTQSTLITASNSVVSLVNGARFCRVFWKVGSSATLGTGSTFIGHIFALTSITANTGAMIQGQLLARNGAVTLDTNTIINGFCGPFATATPAPTSTVPLVTLPPLATLPPGVTFIPGTTLVPVVVIVPAVTLYPPWATLPPGVTFIPGTTLFPYVSPAPSSTTLPPTGDHTAGISTLGIIALAAGIGLVLTGVWLYVDKQRKTKS